MNLDRSIPESVGCHSYGQVSFHLELLSRDTDPHYSVNLRSHLRTDSNTTKPCPKQKVRQYPILTHRLTRH